MVGVHRFLNYGVYREPVSPAGSPKWLYLHLRETEVKFSFWGGYFCLRMDKKLSLGKETPEGFYD